MSNGYYDSDNNTAAGGKSSTSFLSDDKSETGGSSNLNYECPICLNWLKDPVLTACGHHFCKNCIISWIDNRNPSCPIDLTVLNKDTDIFPDNAIKRKIADIKIYCPNAQFGCKASDSPLKMDKHVENCQYRRDKDESICRFKIIGCNFVSTRLSRSDLKDHYQEQSEHHMNLLLDAYKKTKITEEKTKDWDANKVEQGGKKRQPYEADENIIKAMCDRIVSLEQRCIKLESGMEKCNLNRTPSTESNESQIIKSHVDPRYCNGVMVWEIFPFSSTVEEMKSNINKLYYSREFYISPHSYKFCARMSISPNKEFISLHVHLMKSENDYHLEWPFKGRIKIIMIHQRDHRNHISDTIMSPPDMLAFHQPQQNISPRGFGFVEYAKISDIINKGFINNDRFVIKIEMNVV